MNKIFRVIWNVSLQCWVVVSELTRSYGKRKSESRQAKRTRLASISVLSGLAMLGTVNASTVTWSPTGQNSGGSGTWNTVNSIWYNGTILMPWNNAAGDSALFGGSGGTVTLAGGLTVQDLNFTSDGYSLLGGNIRLASSSSVVNVARGALATIHSSITGSGLLSANGEGTLVLRGTNTYMGGTSISGNGIVDVFNDSNLGAATGVLTLGGELTTGTLNITGVFDSARNISINTGGGYIHILPNETAIFNGVLSGNGALGLSGTGTTVLNGANTYTGTMTVGAGGTLQVGRGEATGALGSGSTVNNGVLIFNRNNAYSYSGLISGSGSVQKFGSGITTLGGNGTFTGGVVVSEGRLVLSGDNNKANGASIASAATLQLGNNTSLGWVAGNIANDGHLVFIRTDSPIFSGVISGGGVVRNEAGNITTSGANTYTGGTELRGGTLTVANDRNLGDASGHITFVGNGYLSASAGFTTHRDVEIQNSFTGFVKSTSGVLTLAGSVHGAGSFGVNGGTVVLGGTNNTYSGTTNINAGTLQINDESNLSSNTATGITYSGSGTLRVMSNGGVARNIALNSNGNIDAYNGSVVTLNGTISGGGAFYLYGSGTAGGSIALNGNNTYSGGTAFWTGSRAIVASDRNLGATSGGLRFNGGRLTTTGTFSSGRTVDLNGAGTVDVTDSTTLTLNGVVSGAGRLTKMNTGSLILSGANTWTGGTTINAGVLQVGNGGALGSLGTGNVTNNATLAFNRSDSTSYSNIISGTGSLVQSGSGATVLTGNNTYTGATSVSSGSLFVNGNQSSASGLTSVASGASLGGNGTIGGSVTIADGGILTPGASEGVTGTLTIKGNLVLAAGSLLNYSLGQAGAVGGALNDLTVVNGNLTLDGILNVVTPTGGVFDAGVYRIISYLGTFTNNGLVLGSLPSGANATLQTSVAGQVNVINNYAGTTFWDGAINHGNAAIDGGGGSWNSGVGGNSNWTDGSGNVNSNYSTNFAVFQGTPDRVTVDNSLGQVGVTGMQFMTNGYRISGDELALNETTSGGGYSVIRVGDGTVAGSNYSATIDSILSGTVRLSKTDLGNLILTGDNTYSGGTNIAGGTLQLGDGTTNGSILGDIVDASVLALNPANGTTMALSGVISGAGSLRMTGAGTALLTGGNTYTGGTTISSGTLQIGDGSTNGSLPGNVVNNAALVLMPKTGSMLSYTGVISGTGSVTQNGPGTTVFTGANTYTGGTHIATGILQLGNGTTNGSMVGNVVNEGTLAFNVNGSQTYSGVISGSGNVSQRSGTTTLSGINTYTGGTNINGGILSVSKDYNLGDVSSDLLFNGGILSTNITTARDIVLGTAGGKVYSNGATFSGHISGTGTLEFQGGTTYLTGTNTSSGGTILSEYGTLVIRSASALGSGKLTGRSVDIAYGGGGNLRTTQDMTLANDIDLGFTSFYGSSTQQSINFITDAGTILTLTGNINNVGGYRPANGFAKEGGGTLVLANASYQNGGSFPVRVRAGTLAVGDGGTRGTIGSADAQISSGAKLQFNHSDSYLYGGAISGAGAFEQTGSGTSILTGSNLHTGGTSIAAGTLQLGNGGTSGWVAGNITNNGTLAFSRSDNVTFSNIISGNGTLSKLGAGTLTLLGSQAYTGNTIVKTGILQLGDGTTNGSILGNVNIDGGALSFNASNASTTMQSALISGAGGLTKLGLGTTVLTGDNTYHGVTTVSAGSLMVNGNQAAATGTTTVASGASLGGTGTLGGNVTIANGATLASGSNNGTGGTLTINGNLTLNDLSNLNYQFGQVSGVAKNSRTDVNGNLTLDGRLNVTTPTGGTFSTGVYRVFNYAGALTNNGLVLGAVPASTTLALQVSVPGQVNLINSTGQLLAFWDGMNATNYNQGGGEGGDGSWRILGQTSWADVSGSINSAYGNQSFAVFSGTAGNVTVDNSWGLVQASGVQFMTDGYVINGSPVTLVNSPVDGSSPDVRVGDGSEAGRSITATINSVLQGTTSVTKTDLGTLVLTGNNTYSGGTHINGGTLQLSSDTNLGASVGALSFDGGTLATSSSFGTSRTVTLNVGNGTIKTAAGTALTMAGVVGGNGLLTKKDDGTLILTGTNTWTGGIAVNDGVVQISRDVNLGAATGSLTLDGGTLEVTGSFGTSRATTLNAGGGTVDTAIGTTLTMNSIAGGSGSLTKAGTGTLTLTNNNTYSGGTTITDGTLQLGSGGTGGSVAGNVTTNGALVFNRSNTATFAGIISGSGTVSQIGSGKTVLTGTNTWSGGTTISDGTLVAQNGAALGAGTVANHTTLQLDVAQNDTVANMLTGSGLLSKTGSGTVTLIGSGSREGAVAVSGGTLAFGQSGDFNADSLSVANGAGVAVSANADVVLSGAYSQVAGASLSVVQGAQPAISAGTANLNGTLNLSGYNVAPPSSASGITAAQYTVIHTTNGITGNFSGVNLNGVASPVDYLRLAGRISGNDYTVGYGLSWLEGAANGTGSFTLAGATDAFNVDVALGNQAAGAYLSSWDGKTLTKAGAGTLTLSAANSYTGDTRVNDGTLKAGAANAFAQSANVVVAGSATLDLNNHNQMAQNLAGTGDVTLGSARLTAHALSDTVFRGVISGSGALVKTGSGVLTLTGTNTWSGGTTISDGTLQLGDGGASGTIVGDVTDNSTLVFNRNNSMTLAGTLSGSGQVIQAGSGRTLLTGTNTFSGGTTVSAGTLQLGDGGTRGSVQGAIDVAAGATLSVNWGADYTLNNTLTGSGLVTAGATGHGIAFSSASIGRGFTGMFALHDASFSLGGSNTGALSAATLQLDSGSTMTVEDGTQTISGLTINGGKMIFNTTVPAQIVASSLVQASTLDVTGMGAVRVTLPMPYVLPVPPVSSTDLSLLEQDDLNVGTRLVSAGSVTGSAGALALEDQNGSIISAGQDVDVQQGANVVAIGSYDYRLSTGASQDGLYVSYGLTQLDLQAGQMLTLAQHTGATGASADMSAKITGSGSLRVDAGSGVLSLSNTRNNFTGDTLVATGTLQASAVDVLATSANVMVNGGAVLDTHGYRQSVSNLTGAGTVTGGTTTASTLTLRNTATSVFSGDITGTRLALVQETGTQVLTGANSWEAGTTINTGASLQLGNGTTTGSMIGNVTDNGTLAFNRSDMTMFSDVISGSGTVIQAGTGTTVFTGMNTYSGGTTISAGTLQLGSGGVEGVISGNVKDNGTLAFKRSDSVMFSGVISGSGTVSQVGTGTTVLTVGNTYSGGSTISNGTLQLNENRGAGTGEITINTALDNVNAGLALVFGIAGHFNNQLKGTGVTTVSGAQATVTGTNTGYAGNWRVTDTGSLAIATGAINSIENLGVGGVDIAAGGTFSALTAGVFSFDNTLTGAGTLNTGGYGQAFSFGNGVGSTFSGTVVLTDNTFALAGNNATALTHATLNVGAGNVTNVGDGNQQTQGLVIDGGTMQFNASAPEQTVATSLITTSSLDISRTGTVGILIPQPYLPTGQEGNNTDNLLTQDEANVGVQLVRAAATEGSGGALSLVDSDGNAITSARQVDISQQGRIVAQGTYDYRLTSGSAADGLYVNYGLTQLDLQSEQTLTLTEDSGASGVAADMSAKITGSGNLAVDAATGVVSLSNTLNNYTGQTTVNSGLLRAEADNVLGQTSQLNLPASSGFDLNGKLQTIGVLNSSNGSVLNLNGGSLTVSHGGISAGRLSGRGQFTVSGGTLTVQGDNQELHASTYIATDGTVNMNNVNGLGGGDITNNGTLELDGSVGTMANNINGTGALVKRGAGETVLTGNTGWEGFTYIDDGALTLDGSLGGAQLVSNVVAKNNTVLSLRNGAMLTGWIDPTDVNIDSGSRWNMTANSRVNTVNLAGTVNFVAPISPSMTPGHTLTAMHWNGQGGTVVLNTVLNGDTSATDQLVVNGDTRGDTLVKVNNMGGNGAQTVEGIQIVKVNGQSNGTFTKLGRIVAGAYDYSLVKKGTDWFLTSQNTTAPEKKAGIPTVRPESASYTANLAAANTMFLLRMHDRASDTEYTDIVTGEQKVTSMWLRQVGGHNRWKDSSGQNDTQSNRYITQLGGEIAQWSPDGEQRWHFGVMAGYGHSNSNSTSDVTGYHSEGSVNGYNTGIYATWFENDETKQGLYLDSWTQYSWFNNNVNGESLHSESYRSKGLTASLELGYTHKMERSPEKHHAQGEWYIQPQFQAVWMGVKADDHYEDNGTNIVGEGDGNIQTRLGIRTFMKNHSKLDEEHQRNFKPFVEVNWIHNTKSFGTRMNDSQSFVAGTRNTAEIKTGVEGQLNTHLTVWGDVGVQVGDKGYSDTSAMLGVKYNF